MHPKLISRKILKKCQTYVLTGGTEEDNCIGGKGGEARGCSDVGDEVEAILEAAAKVSEDISSPSSSFEGCNNFFVLEAFGLWDDGLCIRNFRSASKK